MKEKHWSRKPGGKPAGQEGFHHKHSLGQNFLEDEALLDELAGYSLAGEENGVLEIGPGFGALTKPLAARAKKVVSVEIDASLLPFLEVALEKYPNAEVVSGDAMKMDLAALVKEKFDGVRNLRVAANLPYYITTDILTRIVDELPQAESIAVMVQKEVGEKFLSGVREEGYGPFPIRLQYLYDIHIAKIVPAGCFTPPPKVDSCFVVMERRSEPLYPVCDTELLFRLVRTAFAMRRKTLLNNLMTGLAMDRARAEEALAACGIDPKARAEEIDIPGFCRLADYLKK